MIDEVEQRRKQLNLTQKELCEAAGVHPTTYGRLKAETSSGYGTTWRLLKQALDRFEQRRDAA